MCCAVLCRYKYCDGPSPVQGALPKCVEGFEVSEVHSDSEHATGPNPVELDNILAVCQKYDVSSSQMY